MVVVVVVLLGLKQMIDGTRQDSPWYMKELDYILLKITKLRKFGGVRSRYGES